MRLCIAFLCGVACLACGGSDEPEPRTRAEFCLDWAEAACSEEVISVCQADSAEACLDSQAEFCDDLVPESFSDVQADACLAAVSAAYEDADLTAQELGVVLRLDSPCDAIHAGMRQEGESCEASRECDQAAGFECVKKAGSMEGTCEQPEVVGGGRSCEAAQIVCEEGFFCDGDNCIEALDEGDACTIDEECAPAGFCNAEDECEDRYSVNTPCDRDGQCAAGICYTFEDESVCTDRIRLARADPLCDALM